MSIPFTQYLRPDGVPREVEVSASPELSHRARQCFERGARFEAEILTTGEVSLTARLEDDPEEESIAIEIVPNGPEVTAAVERLVLAVDDALAARGK